MGYKERQLKRYWATSTLVRGRDFMKFLSKKDRLRIERAIASLARSDWNRLSLCAVKLKADLIITYDRISRKIKETSSGGSIGRFKGYHG